MDIDKLFKVPKPPISGNKRKFLDTPTPEALKRMRMGGDTPSPNPPENGHQNGSSHSKRAVRATTVEEVDDEGDEVSTSDFAPGGDADYFVEEDDEGRFFGGGLTSEQKDILNIFDNAVQDTVQEDNEGLSTTSIRRILNRFERAVNKNQDQRSKHPDDPTKFIESEADLDGAIKSLLPLAQVPAKSYPELIQSGSVTMLIGLLSHENADIAIDAVEVIHELTDEDAGERDEEDADESTNALKILVDSLLEHSVLDLLVDNLSRLNEEEESDQVGVFHVLGIFENILGFSPQISTALVANTNILPWLLNRVQAQKHDDNRCYSAEILSILLQDNTENRLQLGKKDGVDTLLRVLSQYRRRDPEDSDELEFMENLFDALCSSLNEPAIKQFFVEAEGPELMILMMQEKRQARSRAVKTLDYAMSGSAGDKPCSAFVAASGLKPLFSVFMGKKQAKTVQAAQTTEEASHILGIISSLFSNLASESIERIRLLAKFVESDYEKIDKLLDIRESARARLRATEMDIETLKELGSLEETDEDSVYLRRLDGGLFTLQTVDYILAWVAMEDDGARAHLTKMLGRRDQGLKDIVASLRTYHDNVDINLDGPSRDHDGGQSQRAILEGLIAALLPAS